MSKLLNSVMYHVGTTGRALADKLTGDPSITVIQHTKDMVREAHVSYVAGTKATLVKDQQALDSKEAAFRKVVRARIRANGDTVRKGY